jgi:hypothetical protein
VRGCGGGKRACGAWDGGVGAESAQTISSGESFPILLRVRFVPRGRGAPETLVEGPVSVERNAYVAPSPGEVVIELDNRGSMMTPHRLQLVARVRAGRGGWCWVCGARGEGRGCAGGQ